MSTSVPRPSSGSMSLTTKPSRSNRPTSCVIAGWVIPPEAASLVSRVPPSSARVWSTARAEILRPPLPARCRTSNSALRRRALSMSSRKSKRSCGSTPNVYHNRIHRDPHSTDTPVYQDCDNTMYTRPFRRKRCTRAAAPSQREAKVHPRSCTRRGDAPPTSRDLCHPNPFDSFAATTRVCLHRPVLSSAVWSSLKYIREL
jgi:hypothetical protein